MVFALLPACEFSHGGAHDQPTPGQVGLVVAPCRGSGSQSLPGLGGEVAEAQPQLGRCVDDAGRGPRGPFPWPVHFGVHMFAMAQGTGTQPVRSETAARGTVCVCAPTTHRARPPPPAGLLWAADGCFQAWRRLPHVHTGFPRTCPEPSVRPGRKLLEEPRARPALPQATRPRAANRLGP